MKTRFSLKLFLTFMGFGFVLFLFTALLSYNIFEKRLEKDNSLQFSNYVKNIEEYLKEFIYHNSLVVESIYNYPSLKNFDKESLIHNIKTVMSANYEILEVSIRDSFGKELLDIQEKNNQISRDIDLMKIMKLKEGQLWYSQIEPSFIESEIQYPIIPIIYFAKKSKEHIVIVHIKAYKLLKLLNRLDFILDADGNVIYDKSGQYSWSKYYNKKFELKTIFKSFDKSMLTHPFTVTYENYFKPIKLDNKIYLVTVGNANFLNIKGFLSEYSSSLYNIAFITFIISFILAMIFTTPLSNINEKLMAEKDDLKDSMKKERLILSDSLEVINEYVMYLKLDLEFNIIDISKSFCEVSGYQKEELLGQSYSMLFPKEEFNFIKPQLYLDLAKDGKYKNEMLSQKKMGDTYWVEVQLEANYEDEKLISYTEIRTDISDKKRIEKLYEDLYNQIEQLNIVFENAHSGIALIDLEGNFKRFNKAFSDIFSYSQNEIENKNFLTLVDNNEKEFLNEIIKEVKESGSITNVELTFISKNGEDIYLEVSLKMLPNRLNIVLAINSLEDKRKLQELNQNLEEKVIKEVENNVLKDKLHLEEQIKSAKLTSIGTLAAGITHEINTPLTYLKGNFEMIGMDVEDLPPSVQKEDIQDSLLKIDDAINRIALIVESMREVSQVSSEQKEKTNIFATIVTSLTMAYNTSKQVSRIYLNDKEFTLTNIKKNDLEIFVDVQKQRIEQVWIIIINNALDELKKIDEYEKRELRIDVSRQDDEAIVSFSDNAGGIKDEVLPKIFEPFTSTKIHGGMGIGLNIAKKIVDEQEGKLIAFNKNNGAVFQISLKINES